MTKQTNTEKSIPVDAVLELADKAAQAASIGGTGPETPPVEAAPTNQNQVQVNVDFLRTTKCHIAMACYGGMLTESTFMSFIKFANQARQLGVDWTLETMVNESLITRGRNTLTAKFLHQKESTHLMQIDSDIGFEPWHILVLLNHDKNIAAGLYPMKTLPLRWVVNGLEGGELVDGVLQEVSKAATGFLLVKRQVFEDMKAHPAVKPYKNDIGLDPVYDQYLRTYFDTGVREGRYLSEDWTFCANARDLGMRIWVDRRVLLRHSGHFTFSQESNQHLHNTFGQMYLNEQVNAGKVTLVDQTGNPIA